MNCRGPTNGPRATDHEPRFLAERRGPFAFDKLRPGTRSLRSLLRVNLHPAGFKFIFWGELAERSSYYGMRTVLALYMTSILGFKENTAAFVMTTFIACCYLAPMLGAVIADQWLGRYKTILYFSGPY